MTFVIIGAVVLLVVLLGLALRARSARSAMTIPTEQRRDVEAFATELAAEGALEDAVLELLHDGNKIAAIKLYRRHTNTGLKEAKDAVEAIERGEAVQPLHAGVFAVPESVDALILRGNKIAAIRQYRTEHPSAGLKEAKDAVEARERELKARA